MTTQVLYCKWEIGYHPVTLEEAFKLSLHWGFTIEKIFADEVSLKESSV